MRQTFVLVLMFLVSNSNFATGQETDFFWSDKDLNSGAVNGPLLVDGLIPGDTGSLFLYYSTNGPINSNIELGAFLDIQTSKPGIINFTNAETFDFDLVVDETGANVGARWEDSSTFGQTGIVTANSIDQWSAFGAFGSGIRSQFTQPPIVDTGYDVQADAFLFGRVDYVVSFIGSVRIQIGPGQGGIAREFPGLQGGEFIEPSFGSALITSGFFGVGDVNQDGEVSLLDIGPFVTALQSQSDIFTEADVNCDNQVNLLDVQPFVNLLGGDFSFEVVDPTVENDKPNFGMLGDVNDDGFIDLLDVGSLRNHFANDAPILFEQADINGDGVVDLFDGFLLLDLLLNQR